MTDFDYETILPGIVEIYENGRVVEYHNRLGNIKNVQAFIDENFYSSPSGYDSTTQDKSILITFLLSDVPNIGRGDVIVDTKRGVTYEVVSDVPEESTQFEKAVSAK